MRRILGGAAVLATAAVLTLAAPAQAQDDIYAASPWEALDTGHESGVWSPDANVGPSALSAIVDAHTVVLQWEPGKVPSNLGTSVETLNLGLAVEDGTIVSYRYELAEGATCSGGAPRVFVFVDGTNHNSAGDCGTDQVVQLEIPAGTIGYMGLVYDNSVAGRVTITEVRIGDRPVSFLPAGEQPGDEQQPPAEEDEDAKGGSDEDSGDKEDTAGAGGSSGQLPVTGAPAGLLAAGALVMLGAGGGLLVVARRRRVPIG